MHTGIRKNILNEDATVFDVGCGSGILTIAAAKLGAKLSVGVDLGSSSC